ncbi:hypothetical protein PhCBS80983_g02527 [Powellomyces hirtus]|uniref:Plus3 domain-containing protein n=1 Tax=Powellomyces hirtus TaxID=109895 RepID=A0A507E895_9FUNG|nr:hypothetical protein PhCBS80983_g02527 [Powellomyces hirtus]
MDDTLLAMIFGGAGGQPGVVPPGAPTPEEEKEKEKQRQRELEEERERQRQREEELEREREREREREKQKEKERAAAQAIPRRTRQGARLGSDSDDEQQSSDEDDLLSDGEEWADVKKWEVGSLMGDYEDRRRLAALSELEREKVLAERRSRVEKMKERMEVKKMLRRRQSGQSKNKRLHDEDDERPAKRQTTEKARRADSMAHLRREREKKTARALKEDDDDDYVEVNNVSSQRSNEALMEDQRVEPKERDIDNERDTQELLRALPSFSELLSIQVTRAELADWVFNPFFEKAVGGCFVRYGVGADAKDPSRNVYRICQIDGIKAASRPYQVDGKLVPKLATMSHASAQRENTFSKVSNSRITESEYKRWVQTMVFEKVSWPPGHVPRKQDDLEKARNYTLSSEEVAKIVEQKKALQKVPINITTAVPELQRKLMYAEELGDADAQKAIRIQLDKLMAMVPKKDLSMPMSAREKAPEAGRLPIGRKPMEFRPKPIPMSAITNKWDSYFAMDPMLDDIKL